VAAKSVRARYWAGRSAAADRSAAAEQFAYLSAYVASDIADCEMTETITDARADRAAGYLADAAASMTTMQADAAEARARMLEVCADIVRQYFDLINLEHPEHRWVLEFKGYSSLAREQGYQ